GVATPCGAGHARHARGRPEPDPGTPRDRGRAARPRRREGGDIDAAAPDNRYRIRAQTGPIAAPSLWRRHNHRMTELPFPREAYDTWASKPLRYLLVHGV